ncbi:MAG: guanylate kinase [Lachnospiraceae bacterium]|nr:guanylate kinase [Lachnospiraceae bacterium]
MGRIYYLMGKSSSGKDTIFRELLNNNNLGLHTIVGYTTRPIREGEKEGVEYHFVSVEKMNKMKENGLIIEQRDYNTVHGVWSYFTAIDEQVDLKKNNYILIGTLEAYVKIKKFYGSENVEPVYIEIDDGERLMRALKREMQQQEPKYEEMCRRFIADAKDFSEDKLQKCGIVKRYRNDDIKDCIQAIVKVIKEADN